jgi:BON domain
VEGDLARRFAGHGHDLNVARDGFRKVGVPTGQVSVNADNAVVFLRGQLESDGQIEELVRAIHAIEGVKGVKNLLHTPTTTTEGA